MDKEQKKQPTTPSKKKRQADIVLDRSNVEEEQAILPSTPQTQASEVPYFTGFRPSPSRQQESAVTDYLHFFRIYGSDEGCSGLAFYFTPRYRSNSTSWAGKLWKDVLDKRQLDPEIRGTVEVNGLYFEKWSYSLHEKNITTTYKGYPERAFLLFTPNVRTCDDKAYHATAKVICYVLNQEGKAQEDTKAANNSDYKKKVTICEPAPQKLVDLNLENVWSDIVGLKGAKDIVFRRYNDRDCILEDEDWGFKNESIFLSFFRKSELSAEHEIVKALCARKLFSANKN